MCKCEDWALVPGFSQNVTVLGGIPPPLWQMILSGKLHLESSALVHHERMTEWHS